MSTGERELAETRGFMVKRKLLRTTRRSRILSYYLFFLFFFLFFSSILSTHIKLLNEIINNFQFHFILNVLLGKFINSLFIHEDNHIEKLLGFINNYYFK